MSRNAQPEISFSPPYMQGRGFGYDFCFTPKPQYSGLPSHFFQVKESNIVFHASLQDIMLPRTENQGLYVLGCVFQYKFV